MRILLVEDDALIADGVVMALRQAGFVVNAVANGADACAALRADPPDIRASVQHHRGLHRPGPIGPRAQRQLCALGRPHHPLGDRTVGGDVACGQEGLQ